MLSDQKRSWGENKGRNHPLKTESRPRVPPATVAIGRAYERFLELPMSVVLWLLGALILGAVVMGAYSAVVWLSAATTLP